MAPSETDRPVALVTGVGRSEGIGAAVADALAADGWTVATTHWTGYDERMPWHDPDKEIPTPGAITLEADLADPLAPDRLFGAVRGALGHVNALVMCHCESVDSGILDTSVESWDLHFAVNARATWLLIKAYAEQLSAGPASDQPRRIVAFTSDHVAHNLPYGASKGALDRIVIAAATELADLNVRANVINPGATDTGWMDDEVTDFVMNRNLQPRIGTTDDAAALVRFLCSAEGGWINGQLLSSDGGLRH